jgi:hypothetical protein
MKRLLLLVMIAGCALGACGQHYVEGAYPCRPETLASDCPPAWFCHDDNRCWSMAEVPDAGIDAAVVSDAGADANLDAHACSVETCNGVDDDCDGRFDEGTVVVGPGVVFASTARASHPRIVGVGDAFVAVFSTPDLPDEAWQRLTTLGAPQGATIGLGGSGNSALPVFDGSRVLVPFSDSVNAYDAATGAPDWAMPWMSHPRLLVDPTPSRVAIYSPSPTGSSTRYFDRTRIDTTSATSSRTIHVVPAGSGDVYYGWGSATRAGTDEVYVGVAAPPDASAESLVLRRGATGNGEALSDVGTVARASDVQQYANVSIAVFDPDRAIAADNPLAIAWEQGMSSNLHTWFAAVTSLDPFTMSLPIPLPDSLGPPFHNADGEPFVSIVHPPGETQAGHWYIVSQEPVAPDDFTSMSVTRAWEISTENPSGRSLVIPASTPTEATAVTLAVAGGVVRFAARGPDGLTTYPIECP